MTNEMWEKSQAQFKKFEASRVENNMSIKTKVYETQAAAFEVKDTCLDTLFMGLSSEVGELLGERLEEKRTDRDDINRTEESLNELSDILWYVARISDRLGSNLEELMRRNLIKLEDRALNGKKSYKNKD
jgi:NTP pyrophosphatase (non-canonical NTP hydrolase)